MNNTFPPDTSGGASSANTVRGLHGKTVGPSGSHFFFGPLQKASGPRKKEKTAMSRFWDTHHSALSLYISTYHTRKTVSSESEAKTAVRGTPEKYRTPSASHMIGNILNETVQGVVCASGVPPSETNRLSRKNDT